MSKHTPGPWKMELVEDYCEPDYREIKIESGWIKGVIQYDKCGSHRPKWLNPADIPLVLAAPEMYAALKSCIAYMNGAGIKWGEQYNDVIAKAEGKINSPHTLD